MTRPLSNIEWYTFQQEVDVDALDLPQWGGIVEWRGMDVLVFEGPGGLYLSDVTSFQQSPDERLRTWKAQVPVYWDSDSEVWYYQFPEQFKSVLAERATQVTNATEETVAAIAKTAKQIIAGAGDIAEGIDWYIIAAIAAAVFILPQVLSSRHNA
jgi:hypothetical protein